MSILLNRPVYLHKRVEDDELVEAGIPEREWRHLRQGEMNAVEVRTRPEPAVLIVCMIHGTRYLVPDNWVYLPPVQRVT